MKTRQAMT